MVRTRIFQVGAVALFVVFLLTKLAGFAYRQPYIRFLEATFSPDKVISSPNLIFRKIDLTFLFVGALWAALFKVAPDLLLKEFLARNIGPLKMRMKAAYAIAFLLMLMWPFFRYVDPLYMEDGPLESLTALLFLGSSILMAIKLIKLGSAKRWQALFVVLVFFILSMEEISWGQRVFGWQTPEALKIWNYQQETNIHNLFNPLLLYAYPVFNLLLGQFLVSLDKIRAHLSRLSNRESLLSLLPSSDFGLFGYLFMVLIIQSQAAGGELTEEVLSVFVFAYATSILLDASGETDAP